MACTVCCEILKIDNFNQAPIELQEAQIESRECPRCLMDYCAMHALKIGVGTDRWNKGCPLCSNQDAEIIPLLPKGMVANNRQDLLMDVQLWKYSQRF